MMAAALGALIAVPLAALLAAAIYARAAVLGVLGLARILRVFLEQAVSEKPDSPSNRLAS